MSLNGVCATRNGLSNSARFSRNSFRTRFVAVPQALNVNANSLPIVSAALASGLYPKILSIVSNELHTITNNQPVAIVSSCEPDGRLR